MVQISLGLNYYCKLKKHFNFLVLFNGIVLCNIKKCYTKNIGL